MFGILNINKPAGWTSRDAVNRVQGLVRPAKVGHAGTLDPLATGVLVVCVGPATRLIEYVQRMPKNYVATFQLGVTSPSDDTELETTSLVSAAVPTIAEIGAALPHFIGDIEQRPPKYSAVKVRGRRAYDLARKGNDVELAARTVAIHSIDILRYEYPELVLDISCGSGTYIRSLGRDLAESLDTGAVMSALERTAIGDFGLTQALPVDNLSREQVESRLQPAVRAIAALAPIRLTNDQVAAIRCGRAIHVELCGTDEAVGLTSAGELVAILRPGDPGAWKPKIVFPVAATS